jgi:hypothetical protein
MTDTPKAEAILGHWVHSHEDDAGDQKVFRPASYQFPPSRGRSWFQLKPGGALVEGGPGPTDRATSSTGYWNLADNALTFHMQKGAAHTRKLTIVAVAPDKLVVKM